MSMLAESFDLPILDWIAENLQCGFLNAVMPVITLLGDAGIFWIVLSLALFLASQVMRSLGIPSIFTFWIFKRSISLAYPLPRSEGRTVYPQCPPQVPRTG